MVQQQRNYAFIDSQNLNLGIKSNGWTLDFKKFRLYLKNKFNVSEAYIFIGMVPGNEALYSQLSQFGYKIIFKPTVEYVENGKKTHKGNVDAELVLYAAAKEYDNFDEAIIVSGDGDFTCLVEYLNERNKLKKILCPNRHYSSLLRKYSDKIFTLDRAKVSLEYKKASNIKKDQHRRSVETLGVSGHGDTSNIAKKHKKVNNKKVYGR